MKLFKITLVCFISLMASHAFSAEAAAGELKPLLTTPEAKAKKALLRRQVQETFESGIMRSPFLGHLSAETKAYLVKTVIQARKRRIHFSPEVKKHDGLLPDIHLFDDVVHDLFNRPSDRYKTLDHLKLSLASEPGKLTRKLFFLGGKVCDLVERSAERSAAGLKNKTQVLPQGGGRSNVIDGRFSYWLAKLYNDHLCEKLEDKFSTEKLAELTLLARKVTAALK